MRVGHLAAIAVAVAVACGATACTSSVTGQAVPAAQPNGPTLAVIPARTVPGSAAIPVTMDRNAGVVLVGKPGAKVVVDLYEDYLCPVCGRFDSMFSADIDKQFAAGTVQVRYHPLDLLDESSVPPGYSLLAANAALAVATASPAKFLDFQSSLFGHQPQETGPGWTVGDLKNLAVRLGAGNAQFDALVDTGNYDQVIKANLATANSDPTLQQPGGGFGTPTVVAGGKVVDWSGNPNWLDSLVATAYSR